MFSDLINGFNSKKVDVFIHSPRGSAEATKSLVSLLRENFNHIRFIVPNMAKSAATMMVLSGNEILMDDRSELGPIDPQIQINGIFVPAQTITLSASRVRLSMGTSIELCFFMDASRRCVP